jgi:hypothetical protein
MPDVSAIRTVIDHTWTTIHVLGDRRLSPALWGRSIIVKVWHCICLVWPESLNDEDEIVVSAFGMSCQVGFREFFDYEIVYFVGFFHRQLSPNILLRGFETVSLLCEVVGLITITTERNKVEKRDDSEEAGRSQQRQSFHSRTLHGYWYCSPSIKNSRTYNRIRRATISSMSPVSIKNDEILPIRWDNRMHAPSQSGKVRIEGGDRTP